MEWFYMITASAMKELTQELFFMMRRSIITKRSILDVATALDPPLLMNLVN